VRAGRAGAGSSFARSATSSAVRPELSRIRKYATCGSLSSAISSPAHPACAPSRIRILAIADAPSRRARAPCCSYRQHRDATPTERSRDGVGASLPCDAQRGRRAAGILAHLCRGVGSYHSAEGQLRSNVRLIVSSAIRSRPALLLPGRVVAGSVRGCAACGRVAITPSGAASLYRCHGRGGSRLIAAAREIEVLV
jgi:hypothetical protein